MAGPAFLELEKTLPHMHFVNKIRAGLQVPDELLVGNMRIRQCIRLSLRNLAAGWSSAENFAHLIGWLCVVVRLFCER